MRRRLIPSPLIALLLLLSSACGKSSDEKLFASTSRSDISAASKLIRKGANVNARDPAGSTPLHCANSLQMASFLISNGASLNSINNAGLTPLHIATRQRNMQLVELLLSKGADANARREGSGNALYEVQTADMARQLIEHGANANEADANGVSPLHIAAGKNRIDVVRFLLKQGADINAQDKQTGDSPLHYAMAVAFPDMAQLLLDSGASIDMPNASGYTPLHYSTKSGCIRVVRYMLLRGANPGAITQYRDSVLDFAIGSGNPALEELVRQGQLTYPAQIVQTMADNAAPADKFSRICAAIESRRYRRLGLTANILQTKKELQ